MNVAQRNNNSLRVLEISSEDSYRGNRLTQLLLLQHERKVNTKTERPPMRTGLSRLGRAATFLSIGLVEPRGIEPLTS